MDKSSKQRRSSITRKSFKEEAGLDSLANVKAGFHEDLLPSWGGKVEMAMKQDKCWTSKQVIQRRNETLIRDSPVTETKREMKTMSSIRELDQIAVDPTEMVRYSGGINQDDENLLKDETRDTLMMKSIQASNDQGLSDVEYEYAPNRSLSARRVIDMCNRIRSDPTEYTALLKRIEKYKERHQHSSNKLRNVIVENKWLNDDKKQCEEYWEEIAALQKRIDEAETVDMKIGLYSLWPHPPKENHSKDGYLEKTRRRALKHQLRIEENQKKRAEQEEQRKQHLTLLMNRREVEAEQKRAIERARRVYKALFPIIYTANAVQRLESRMEEVLVKAQERKLMSQSACIIQRRWKKTRAAQTGLRFRNAIRVVRKFVMMAAESRRTDKKKKSAQVIHWFLAVYDSSNLQKVMRNYRYRVICCQRYFQGYEQATKYRLKALMMKWDQVEKEKLRVEKVKALTEFKRIIADDPDMMNQAVQTQDPRRQSMMVMKKRQLTRIGGTPGAQGANAVGPLTARALERKQSKMFNMAMSGLHRGDAGAVVGVQGMNAATMAAVVEMGIHIHRKVPKSIKTKLLEEHLSRVRLDFKTKWQGFTRDRKYMEGRKFVTMDDVRSAVQAEDNSELFGILDKKGSDKSTGNRPPFLALFTHTTNDLIDALIERGRNIAEEQALNGLADEIVEES